MRFKHFIAPRQTGKTTKAVSLHDQARISGLNTVIVVPCGSIKRSLHQKFPWLHSTSVITKANFVNPERGARLDFDLIIIDEYLLSRYTPMDWYNIEIHTNPDTQFILLSTPTTLYPDHWINEHSVLYLNPNNPQLEIINIDHTNYVEHGFLAIDYEKRFQSVYRLFPDDWDKGMAEMLGHYMLEHPLIVPFRLRLRKPRKFTRKYLTS